MLDIKLNTLAAACFDQNSIDQLRAALSAGVDSEDCARWGLTTEEWYAQIMCALVAKYAVALDTATDELAQCRAALKPFAELLEEPASAACMELMIDPLDVARAQAVLQEVGK